MILDADFKEADHTLNADFGEYGAVTPVVDQTYKPKSSNAQSGKAVAEAIANTVGDIGIALDELHTYAQSLINGGVAE